VIAALGLQGGYMFISRFRLLIIFLFLVTPTSLLAEENLKTGVTWGYTASGFFSPEVIELIANKVIVNSPAAKAGLEVGHKVISIQGCEIPGCSASIAKDFLKMPVGSVLHLVVETPNGNTKEINIEVGKA
jgi:C-terminal processing protease CtpA/Prc